MPLLLTTYIVEEHNHFAFGKSSFRHNPVHCLVLFAEFFNEALTVETTESILRLLFFIIGGVGLSP
jgi:hypothetical protein